ncbi:hypothetical protein TB1_001190 [Malus domestica]
MEGLAGPTIRFFRLRQRCCLRKASLLEDGGGVQCDLPFEFQVLDIALEVVCTYLTSSMAYLERESYPVLDELARNVAALNLSRE